IRDRNVTGVQTCALPILDAAVDGHLALRRHSQALAGAPPGELESPFVLLDAEPLGPVAALEEVFPPDVGPLPECDRSADHVVDKIGRASCRERGETAAAA